MAKSLAERLSAHEQEKARLAEKEAKLKADGRKARKPGCSNSNPMPSTAPCSR